MVWKFIILCWLIFAAYWTAHGWKVKKTVERTSLANRLRYKVWLWIAIILLAGPTRKIYPWSVLIIPHGRPAEVIGGALCLFGLAGAIWARQTLAGNWSAEVTFKEGHELIERGPYRLVRHPIYTALLLMFLGTAIVNGQVTGLGGVLFCFFGFWLKLKQEEKLMLRHFPNEYPAYRKRVKALVPWVV